MRLLKKLPALLIHTALICGCAGSAPDFERRTSGGPDQEAKLVSMLEQATGLPSRDKMQKITLPLCSSTVGSASTGFAIDGGNWCAIGCDSAAVTEPRWVEGKNGSRCLAAPVTGATELVEIAFSWLELSLEQPDLFKGLGRSFLSDTEWQCKEFNYLIDPDTKQGFWHELTSRGNIYRFHRSGKLSTGRALNLMKLSGSWRVNSNKQVFFNSSEVFKHAIDYGGGRFDNFKTSTNKEVCRYAREADEPV